MLARSPNELEGSECGQLHPDVAFKFFDINFQHDVVRRKAAQNICARCVVAPECLEQALNGPQMRGRGVIAGMSVHEVDQGRAWRRYELGLSDHPPKSPRPIWLTRPDATETVEYARIEEEELSLQRHDGEATA